MVSLVIPILAQNTTKPISSGSKKELALRLSLTGFAFHPELSAAFIG